MRLISCIFPVFFSFFSFAQEYSFHRHDMFLTLRSGYFSNLYNGSQWSVQVPPTSLQFDYCVLDYFTSSEHSIGAGIILNYGQYKASYEGGSLGIDYTVYGLGLRSDYHFYLSSRNDVYGGLMLWYLREDKEPFGNQLQIPDVALGGLKLAFFAGWKFYIRKHGGLMLEAESRVAWINAGIVYRFLYNDFTPKR